jgi:hypothetical protein
MTYIQMISGLIYMLGAVTITSNLAVQSRSYCPRPLSHYIIFDIIRVSYPAPSTECEFFEPIPGCLKTGKLVDFKAVFVCLCIAEAWDLITTWKG